ncbi:thiopeptide-type bacteriocin biosynthesis protein [Streptomyces carpaticus]|uniref:thiopeptide-type bacteriocin biosynthesis protein n=1 Tax=Streptomyces carpaticus TaxID=285558 RepID=UPI00220BC7E9|nr:thiopeptide-type bacteriocin biosynthesis protein [Streptomyces carpaticus]
MDPSTTARAVLATLAGHDLHRAAADHRMNPTDLATAVKLYQAGGLAALETRAATGGWHELRIEFTHWETAEHLAFTALAAHLGSAPGWWFIRKAPCWRLRFPASQPTGAITSQLDNVQASGGITCWWRCHYEPETLAFGGPEGVRIAHDLFHHDSNGILNYLGRATPRIGRRELSILLCTALFRGARQDWYEQGDIWHRVTALRPLAPPRTPLAATGVATLMRSDTRNDGPLFAPHAPLDFAAPWLSAFHTAGRSLGHAANNGTLHRGLRDVLAHHVIFHWNRLGLPAPVQRLLARAARGAVFNP